MGCRTIVQFVTAADVEAHQKRLAAAAKGTDLSVQRCTGIDDATRAAWGAFYGAVIQFTQEPASTWHAGAQDNRACDYDSELAAWQEKLSSSCQLDVPVFDPNKGTAMDAVVSVVKWVSIGLVAVGGAVAVAKVAEVLPHLNINLGKKAAPAKTAPAAAERRRRRR